MGHGKEFDSDIKEPMKRGDFYWPAMPEPDPQALQSDPYPSEEFLTDWLLRTCEIIDRYQPSLLYFDQWLQHDAMMFGSGIVEVECGALADPKPFVWQTDTAIAKNSWCYTDTLEYKTSRQIICNFIEIISKNGNMLLNVGPKGDGEIPEEDQNMLLGSGLTAGLSTEGTVPMSFTGTYIGMFAENGSSAFQEFQVNYVLPDEQEGKSQP